MAKPNYAFEKRQRELAKKKKKEDKQKQKAGPGEDDAPAADEPTGTAITNVPGNEAPDSTP